MMDLILVAVAAALVVYVFKSGNRRERAYWTQINAWQKAGCNCLIEEGVGLTQAAWVGGPSCPVHGKEVWSL